MTRKRIDGHSTEFGLWLREQKQIDSSLGFVATNLDYVWKNFKTGDWMLIEEKRFSGKVTFSQRKLFTHLHKSIQDKKYHGIHLITFENTSPEDGKIYLDNREITKDELLRFLSFSL